MLGCSDEASPQSESSSAAPAPAADAAQQDASPRGAARAVGAASPAARGTTRHEALLCAASADVHCGALAALTELAALHERAFRPTAGNPAGFAPCAAKRQASTLSGERARAAEAAPAEAADAAGREELRAARRREARAAWEDAACHVADACERFPRTPPCGERAQPHEDDGACSVASRLARVALSANADEFLARCLESAERPRHAGDALALVAGALHHGAQADVLDAALGALALYAAEAALDGSAAACAARAALLLLARFALRARFGDAACTARALGALAALAEVPAEAPPDGLPRGTHGGDMLVLVADAMAEHPHEAAVQAAGVGALAALLGARRAPSGAPEYADAAEAMRAWVARGALPRALCAAAAAAAAAAPEPHGSYACEHACHIAAHAMHWSVRELGAGRVQPEQAADVCALDAAAVAVSDALASAGCASDATHAVLGPALRAVAATRAASPAAQPATCAMQQQVQTPPPLPLPLPLPPCVTVLPAAEALAARRAAHEASARAHADAAMAYLAAALNGKSCDECSAAAARSYERTASASAPGGWRALAACISYYGGPDYSDSYAFAVLLRAAPGGASADALLAHCLSPPPPGAPPPTPRDVLALSAGALVHAGAPEASAAALQRAASALRPWRAPPAAAAAAAGLLRVQRALLSAHVGDDVVLCGAALRALTLALRSATPDAALSAQLGALAADAMLMHAPFMAVQAEGAAALAALLVEQDGPAAAGGRPSGVAARPEHARWQRRIALRDAWVRAGALARAPPALLLALRRVAAVAGARRADGRAPTQHGARVFACAPAALAHMLRLLSTDDATVRDLDAEVNGALSGMLDAVMDACATLEAACGDAVVAAADAHLAPALSALLSSRRWWDGGGAAACGPERSERAFAAAARAQSRAGARAAVAVVAAAAPAFHTDFLVWPKAEAPQPPRGIHADDARAPATHAADATHELIESLLAAQADLATRLRLLEKGKARARSPEDPRRAPEGGGAWDGCQEGSSCK
jgi:hypothetical protein